MQASWTSSSKRDQQGKAKQRKEKKGNSNNHAGKGNGKGRGKGNEPMPKLSGKASYGTAKEHVEVEITKPRAVESNAVLPIAEVCNPVVPRFR